MGRLQTETNWEAAAPMGRLVPSPRRLSLATIALVTLWMAALFAGMVGLWKYKLTPGAPALPPPTGAWPAHSRLPVHPNTPTLIMFSHPQCVCTRASLAELRTLASRFGSRVLTTVSFLRPSDASDDFSRSDSWTLAASIPGVRVLGDQDGREAALFGANTSGHVVLYSATGQLLFTGGITPARGHVGNSPQMDRLIELLESETGRQPATGLLTNSSNQPGAVYGCPLEEQLP